MNNLRFASALIALVVCAIDASAQFNIDLDSSKGQRRSASKRDDILWHSEAANTQYSHAGNISLLTDSRFGLNDRLELSTFLAFDFFQPNIAAKYRWNAKPKQWFVSSKVNLGNAYPGMKFAQDHDKTDYIDTIAKIPVVGEIGHELIVSRRFNRDVNCSDGSEWLILTASLGTYWGIDIKSGTVSQIPKHFLANRSMVLIDNNFLCSLKLWADWQMFNWMHLHGGMRFHHWSEKKSFAYELQAEGEVFLTTTMSARLGFAFSAANYKSTKQSCGIIPIADFTYYFGKKKSNERSLFNPNGTLY
ncbi:MAG: hypothetical protein MJZ13_07865 [Bacteroidales bacterium]|nr:hypothetical protein [Bacteroidales bacterium]